MILQLVEINQILSSMHREWQQSGSITDVTVVSCNYVFECHE